MLQRVILLVLVLSLVAVSLGSAASEVVFDKSITDKTTITLNDTTFTVRIGDANNSLVKVQGQNKTILLEEGDCYELHYDEFCYEEFVEAGEIEANQTNSRPVIEVTRTISSKKIDFGEQTTITTTFENTGGSPINDFLFTEKIPSFVSVKNLSGCNKKNNVIIMEDKLSADQSQVCSYVLEGIKVGKGSYFGSITTNKVKPADMEAVPQVDIEVTEPFKFNISLSKSDLYAYQPFVLTIKIENIETKDINLSMEPIRILLDDFSVSKTYFDDMDVFERSKYVDYRIDLEPESTASQRIELIPEILENTTLKITFNYSFQEDNVEPEEKTFEVEVPLQITFFPLTCEYVVIDEAGNNLISLFELNNTLPGLDSGDLSLQIINNNNYLDFSDVSYSISGDFKFPNSGNTKFLRRNDKAIFATSSFFFSDVEPRNYSARANVRYYPQEEELFTSRCNTNFFVPRPKTLEVEKELIFVNQTIDGVQKDVSRIVIRVKNVFFDGIKPIKYREIFPSYFFTNVDFSDELSIDEGETLVFSYDFIIPNEYIPLDKKTKEITSLFTMNFDGVPIIINKTIEVNIQEIIDRQQPISVESIIENKFLELKQSQPVINSSSPINQTPEIIVESTYSPLLPYFSLAILLILLFFIYIIFRSQAKLFFTKYFRLMQIRKHTKKSEETKINLNTVVSISKKSKHRIDELNEQLKKAKKELQKLQKETISFFKSLNKKRSSLEKKIQKKQEAFQKINARKVLLESQQQKIQSEMASFQSQIEQGRVQGEQTKVILTQKTDAVKKLESDVLAEKEHLQRLNKQATNLEHKVEDLEKKDKDVLKLKKQQIEEKLSKLDENRKILKEQEDLLDHPLEKNK